MKSNIEPKSSLEGMTSPLLSVILTSYNYAQYLPQALEALVSQSYPNFELLVVDDGSTDASPTIIHRFAEKYSFIRAFFFKENRGKKSPFAAGEYAFSQALGDYYVFTCADDVVLPGFFQQTMDFLRTHPEVGLCCSIPTFFQGDQINSLQCYDALKL